MAWVLVLHFVKQLAVVDVCGENAEQFQDLAFHMIGNMKAQGKDLKNSSMSEIALNVLENVMNDASSSEQMMKIFSVFSETNGEKAQTLLGIKQSDVNTFMNSGLSGIITPDMQAAYQNRF